MITKIQTKRFLPRIPFKILKKTPPDKKLPVVESPVILPLLMFEPERERNSEISWGEFIGDLFGLKSAQIKKKEIEEQKRIVYEKEQESLRQQRLAREREIERARELERQREIEAERLRQAELEKQLELERQLQEELETSFEDFDEEETEKFDYNYDFELDLDLETETKQNFVKRKLIGLQSFVSRIGENIANLFEETKESVSDWIWDAKFNIKYKIKPEISRVVDKSVCTVKRVLDDKKTQITETMEFKKAQAQFLIKLTRYKVMASDFAYTQPFNNWKKADLNKLCQLDLTLEREIERAKMINKLKREFTKGAEFYLPLGEKQSFQPDKLIEIVPKNIETNNSNSYRAELKRLCMIFENNSEITEPAMITFNEIVSNFFIQASKSIKEIFDLQKNQKNRWLERIPKLGLIPKVLRVSEQIALTNCIMKDYKEISSKYLQKMIIPYFKKYNSQYDKIKAFADKYIPYLSTQDKRFTVRMLKKIKDIKEKRDKTNSNIVDSYTKGGMNINNICKNIRLRGSLELATKTLSTFVSLF